MRTCLAVAFTILGPLLAAVSTAAAGPLDLIGEPPAHEPQTWELGVSAALAAGIVVLALVARSRRHRRHSRA